MQTVAPAAVGRPFAGSLLALVLLAGCNARSEPPQFRLNMQDYLEMIPSHDPAEFRITGGEEPDVLEEKQRKIKGLEMISTVLFAAFGTPDDPYLLTEVQKGDDNENGLDLVAIERAAGPVRPGHDRSSRQRGLYRLHCAHCHGISGDGAGPTAVFLNPYPRDYRQGKFKFKSTEASEKPTTADLKRIIMEGIPGTAMPSFALLPNDEIDALVEYVKYLSIRGETELNLAIELFAQEGEIEPDRATIIEYYLSPVVDLWVQAEDAVVQPPERPATDTPQQLAASIEEGRKLFLSKDAQCAQCHGPTGLGDGWLTDKTTVPYDDWNKQKSPDDIDRWLLPRQELRPRNLRLGIYRGGRRPVDLYRRIHAGILGAQMPGAGPAPGKPATLTPEQIWHLVDYVRSLPYADESQPKHTEITLHKPRN
ncbi:MAG: c-type cytochrome [Pirellulales bacterium]